jgi:DNA polymerase-1
MDEAADLLLELELPKGLGAADWSGELDGDMVRYAAGDPRVTFLLRQEQAARFDATDECSQNISDECLVATANMELAGLPHDADAHRQFIAAVEQELETAVAALADATGGKLIGDPTPTELGAYLEQVLDDEELAAWPRTKKTGALATDKVTLSQDFAADIPGIKELLTVRQWTKALSTYGSSLLERADDGRIYARFLVAGGRAGRYSCRGPNLQQLPKRGKHELLATFRRVIAAPPGRVIMAADYSQIELRIMAQLAQDETMLGAFATGADVHMAMAQNLAGDAWDALSPEEKSRARGLAKSANFGLIYGSGAAAFARSATANGTPLTEAEAADIIETWRQTYPGIHRWQMEQTYRSRLDGYVQTVGGRRWFWEWRAMHPSDSRLDDLEDYQVPDAIAGYERNYSLNHPVQGSAAEVLAIALAYVDRALVGHDAVVCAVVHDELVLEVADDPVTILTVAGILRVEMTRAWLDFFPDAPWRGLVDVGWGPTWADAH